MWSVFYAHSFCYKPHVFMVSLAGPVVFSDVPDHCLSPQDGQGQPTASPLAAIHPSTIEKRGKYAPKHSVTSESVPVSTCASKSRLAAVWDTLLVQG